MAEALTNHAARFPPGPTEKYRSVDDLFKWMNENFAQYGDICQASIFGGRVYVISSPEYCEHVLRKNWRNYTRSGLVVKRIELLLGNGLIASNGSLWARQRRMMQPAFSKAAVARLVDVITEPNAVLLRKWKEAARQQATINVTHDTSTLILQITLAIIFGEDYQTVAPHFAILKELLSRDLEFAQLFRLLDKVIFNIVERRRQEHRTGSDVLGYVMRARDRDSGHGMSDVQLVRELKTLLVAGHETTASLLNWTWYLLSRHPGSQKKLADELNRIPLGEDFSPANLGRYTYAQKVIDEALRLYPPLWLMTRRAVHDDQLGDFFVPAGTEIYISPYILQRSPRLWDIPEQFEPDRMASKPMSERHELSMCPFGAGPRNCIGETLARAEAQIHLLKFANELWFDCENSNPPEITTGLNLLSKDDFIMRPKLKSNVPHARSVEMPDF